MGDVIPFGMRSQKNPNKVAGIDELFTHHATTGSDHSQYWTHVCPNLGMDTMLNADECRFCGAKKGKQK